MAWEQNIGLQHKTKGCQEEVKSRILVVTAVEAEREAVLRGLNQDARFDVLAVGVGPIAAAVNTTKILANTSCPLVICAGIGGGFPGQAEVGSLVLASEIIAADLGVETPGGFSALEELGFGTTRIAVQPRLIDRVGEALLMANLPISIGPVLTVSTVTGTAESAARLAARFPGAAAEAMEGYGVALAASGYGIPVLELRSISNMVGPRDRAAWQIKEALEMLVKTSTVLAAMLTEELV